MNTKREAKYRNRLELKIIPIKQPKPIFDKNGETSVYYGNLEYDYWTVKPDYIKVRDDDSSPSTLYRRIKNSCYWRIVGLPGYEFALTVRLSI